MQCCSHARTFTPTRKAEFRCPKLVLRLGLNPIFSIFSQMTSRLHKPRKILCWCGAQQRTSYYYRAPQAKKILRNPPNTSIPFKCFSILNAPEHHGLTCTYSQTKLARYSMLRARA